MGQKIQMIVCRVTIFAGMIFFFMMVNLNCIWAEKVSYRILVNRSERYLTIYETTEGEESVRGVMAIGISKDVTGVPVGKDFELSKKQEWHENQDGSFSQYATRITDGLWFVGASYKTKNASDLNTDIYNQLGEYGNVGTDCIMLSTGEAKWIYDNCKAGTKVDILVSGGVLEEGEVPVVIKIPEGHPNAKWDPTDQNDANPWKKETPKISGMKDITIAAGSNIDLMAGVTAIDMLGNDISDRITITGGDSFDTPGEYLVTYYVEDDYGKQCSENIKLTVKSASEMADESEKPSTSYHGSNKPTKGNSEIEQEKKEGGLGMVIFIGAVALIATVGITKWAMK